MAEERTVENPFNEEDKNRIDESLLTLDAAEKLIAKGKLAGLDLAQQEGELKETKAKMRRFRNTFFPNQ